MLSPRHGTAIPADNSALLYGDEITASVDTSVTDGNVRYDCIGWLGTGSAPAVGASNECTFVLKENTSLAWLWRTNYWTTLAVDGPATATFSEGWLAAGNALSVAIAPSVPYYVFALSGDTNGVTLGGTNLVISADGPRAISVEVRELTLAGVLGTTDLAWRTGGDAVWFPQVAQAADDGGAAQSGALDAKGESWIDTTVIGPGTLSFKWRFAPGSANSGIDLMVDGDYEDGLTDATSGWEAYSLGIGAGRHVVRWEFYGSDGDNGAAWLDQVTWDGEYPTTTSTTPTPVPYVWLDANAKFFVSHFYGDYEAVAHAAAANRVNKVWECYVAGISPTNAAARFEARIEIENGVPVVTWSPDLNEGGTRNERVYTVEGRERLGDGWGPTNAASRFFRVKVALPGE